MGRAEKLNKNSLWYKKRHPEIEIKKEEKCLEESAPPVKFWKKKLLSFRKWLIGF